MRVSGSARSADAIPRRVNGLDPEGIRWIRQLLKGLAADGHTVFVSSHLMSEMALTAEHVIVVGRGRLMADMSMAELIAQASSSAVLVRSPQADALADALGSTDVTVSRTDDGSLEITGLTAAEIGDQARDLGISLHGLAPRTASLAAPQPPCSSRSATPDPHTSRDRGPVVVTGGRALSARPSAVDLWARLRAVALAPLS